MTPIADALVGMLICFALGGFFLVPGMQLMHQLQRARGWHAVQGEITDSEINRVEYRRRGVRYQLFAGYRYVVDGREYEGSRIRFGWPHPAPELERLRAAQDWQRRHHAGAPVTVYYDPADPAESVLERGHPDNPLPFVFIGAAFVLAGLGALLRARG